MSNLSTQARGAFMAATLAMFSLGDSIGALIGPLLFSGGMVSNALAAIVFNFLGLFILQMFVKPVELSQEDSSLLKV